MSKIIRTSKSSKDDANEKLVALKQLFPSAFTADGELDVNILKQLVGADDDAGQSAAEKFGLTWAGKSKVFGTVRQTTTKTLKPNRQNSVDFDKTQNLFIEGDNLDALKILERSYFNKVKMIYIDPPYNTGNDFVYNDDFKTTQAEHEQQAGTHDGQGNAKRSDGLTKNSKDKGRYHSNWLNMMYPRLHIARNLLKDDGVIFVSIDDNEVHHLRLIMDEIFGEENFIANAVWNSSNQIMKQTKTIRKDHEYLVCYVKNTGVEFNKLENSMKFSNPDNDPKGPWFSSNAKAGGKYEFEIKLPGGEIAKAKWNFSKDDFENGNVGVYLCGNNVPRRKVYEGEYNKNTAVQSSIFTSENGTTTTGINDTKNLFDDASYFDNPKPVKLIEKILTITTSQNDTVIDFFAGSGTTAHAVMEQNVKDGGNRKFILVQLPEVTDEKSEAYKAGYKTIADIARERIRRAGKKIMADNADKLKNRKTPLDIGFKDFAVAPSNFVEVPKDATDQTQLLLVNNLKSGVKDQDLLTQMRLLQGKTLDIEPTKATFGDLTVYEQDETCFVIQPNANLADLKQLLKAKYSKIVLLDRVFKDSKDMTNFDQEYQALDSQKIIEIC